MAEPELNAIVTLRDEISPWLMILRIVPQDREVPDFKPGQFAVLGLPGSAPRIASADPEDPPAKPDALIRRAYSIASSSVNRQYLEFYIALVTSGALTPRLFALSIGDRIWLGPRISGMFTLDQAPVDKHVVLIATGTGLAPYVSMLGSCLSCGTQRRVAVLHGARHSWDLGYHSHLRMLEQICPNFCYYPVLSRPQYEPAPWPGATGHVQDLWQSRVVAAAWGFEPTPANSHVFLCGAPAMIEDMVLMLGREGFREHTPTSPAEIHVERYW